VLAFNLQGKEIYGSIHPIPAATDFNWCRYAAVGKAALAYLCNNLFKGFVLHRYVCIPNFTATKTNVYICYSLKASRQ
jgi:hypothetical protein